MHRLELEPGVTLLNVPSPRSGIVHRLVCDRLADSDGGAAYWIDARNAASTHALYDCASSPRVFEGLRIARAFTAYQHHSLVRAVARRAGPTTALLVAPNVASLYRDDDLTAWEREDLLAATLEILSELGGILDCPVLLSSARRGGRDGCDRTTDAATGAASDYADTVIDCVRTREGLRLEAAGDGADSATATAGYWHGTVWQTTIPYWVERCGAVDAIDPVITAHDRGLLEVSG
ncbi:hypothetical protein [Natrinema halophilum]|uniref:DNA recombination and repair protein Rad51-like C-terminal domain-containing protein n=1 Tax=Natrinema halophilum TaxID=1699371 RepID=A0A7D5HA55_9EURY|nr:hypothetical protein [Natrinema halophilum]QLG50555.1 hypothetical protein HYG82_17740 [Natrinema halophilum]